MGEAAIKKPEQTSAPASDATAAQPPAVAKKKKDRAPVTIARLRQVEQTRVKYELIVPAGLEPTDMIEDVAFWSHLAGRFKDCRERCCTVDLIVVAEDESWEAEMRVIDAGSNWAKVVFKTTAEGVPLITRWGIAAPTDAAVLPGHVVEWGGVYSKYRVLRLSDRKVLRDNVNTKGEAYSWLADYAKTVKTT